MKLRSNFFIAHDCLKFSMSAAKVSDSALKQKGQLSAASLCLLEYKVCEKVPCHKSSYKCYYGGIVPWNSVLKVIQKCNFLCTLALNKLQ